MIDLAQPKTDAFRSPVMAVKSKKVHPQISQINAKKNRNSICVNLRNLWIKIFFGFAREMQKVRKNFFFEKKKQKTFLLPGDVAKSRVKTNKSFCALFSKSAAYFLTPYFLLESLA